MSAPKPETHLLQLALRTMLLVKKEMQSSAGFELSISQFRVLDQLDNGVTTASDLAVRQRITLPAMSSLVDGLARRNLIRRTHSESDRRVIRLSLSNEGKKLLARIRAAIETMFLERMKDLSAEDILRLKKGFEVLDKLVS